SCCFLSFFFSRSFLLNVSVDLPIFYLKCNISELHWLQVLLIRPVLTLFVLAFQNVRYKKTSPCYGRCLTIIYSVLSYFYIYCVWSFTALFNVKTNNVILTNVVNQT